MDISKLDAEIAQDEEGAVVTIHQKNGEPYKAADGSVATFTVLGSDSAKVRAARESNQRRMLRMRSTKVEPADVRRNRVEAVAAAVIDWHGWEKEGAALPCTPENVKLLLKAEHILQEVEQAIDGHADFFASSSSS